MDTSASSTFGGVIGGTTIAGYTIGSAVNLSKTGSGTFTLTGVNTYTGTTSITQGTLALSGSASISDSSFVNLGGSVLDASGLNSGTFALAANQTLLAGSFFQSSNNLIGNLNTSGTVNVAGVDGAGTFIISGNLALNGGTLLMDLSNTTTAGAHVNDLISIGGSLSLSGTTVIQPDLLSGTLTTGTYTLVSGGTSLTTGNASDLSWGGGALPREAVSFNTTTTPGTIYLVVTSAPGNLVWSGTNGNTWDVNNTVNWSDVGRPDIFLQGDTVTFTDTTSMNATVTLVGSLQPASITVNGTFTSYTFSGTGQISGSTGLLKAGGDTLTISTTNSYTGGTVISTGEVTATNAGALGNGPVTLGDANTGPNYIYLFFSPSGTNTLVFSQPITVSTSGSGTVDIGSVGEGTGLVTISSTLTLDRDTTFQATTPEIFTGPWNGSGNVTFVGGGVTTVGTLPNGATPTWTGSASVASGIAVVIESGNTDLQNSNLNLAAGSAFVFGTGTAPVGSGTFGMLTGSGWFGSGSDATANISIGVGNASSTYAGVIGGGDVDGYTFGSAVNITKIGTGTLTLSGTNTYTGSTTVSQGTLEFANEGSLYNHNTASWNTTNITVASGATLALNVGGAGGFTSSDVGMLAALGTGGGGFQSGAILGLDTTNSGGNFTYSGVIANTNNGSLGLTKLGTGTLTLTGSNTYTGPTTVSQGSLVVNGSIAASSGVTVFAGATLSGSGNVGAISGGGLIAPGDPQIMTATSVNLSGSMSFTFALQQTGSPTYGNASNSGNDVLHLTGASPQPGGPLSSINTVNVDFTGDTFAPGQLYLGGFYTDAALDTAQVGTPVFNFIGLTGSYTAQYEGMVADTANFGSGPIDGTVMEFEIIPEPSTWVLFVVGGAGLISFCKRKKGAWSTRRPTLY